ncbi:MAG TPA: hypothetical protein VFR77_06030 [Steroidobacteraceae bacterium]|nr:hypothetical protein [Steroidobacteraceae bacterium]
MTAGFKLEPRDGYLYVSLDPGFEMTPRNTTQVWTALCETCRELGLRKALAEGDGVVRQLTPMESFDIASLAARLLPGLSVACVFRGYIPDEQSQFFQTTAMNRGVRMEFFQGLNAALRWLGSGSRPAG